MSNNFYDENGPTQPSIRDEYNQPNRPPQEKLILRAPGQQPPAERRPYQNPQQGQQGQPPQPYQRQAPVYPAPQRDQPAAYNQRAPQAVPTPGYPAYPQPAQPYQPGQPGQFAGSAPPEFSRRRRRGGCTIAMLVVLVILVVFGIVGFNILQHVSAFGSHIMVDKNRSPLSSDNGYMNTSERTNLLVLGYGGSGHDGAYLTDSLLTVSLLPQSHHTSLVSLPRDLYVQYPPSSGQYMRINAVYTVASQNNKNPAAGGSAVVQKVSLVTGLNVKYWLTINFNGFKKFIDAIGGVNVYVPDSFNACYPKNDDANVDPSWLKVQFNKGMQHMDGATAITYARAREPAEVCGGVTQNQAELSDFGRAARQQIIVKGVLSEVKQSSTWPRLYSAMDALQDAIQTNMSLADLGAFALKMDLNDPKAAHIGLSNQNVIADSTGYDGGYAAKPVNGDWAVIPAYVKEHLYN